MRPNTTFLLASLIVGLSGCAVPIESGTQINIQYADQIVIGKTTKSEVLANLGKPADIQDSGDEESWQYEHMSGEAGTALVYDWGSGQQEDLTVAFKGNVVSDCLLKITRTSGQGFAASMQDKSEAQHCGKRR